MSVSISAIQIDLDAFIAVRFTMQEHAIKATEVWCYSNDDSERWMKPGNGWTPVYFSTRDDALAVGRRQQQRGRGMLCLSRAFPR